MIDLQPLLAFAGTALVLTMAPGLDTATVLRTSAAESTRHGMLAALASASAACYWERPWRSGWARCWRRRNWPSRC